ncbi:MAG: tetratricopeptide repeat protein [Candidatus Eisenbacteria bacterium]|nr:tetratricopeptide repeat protein [Candidatus Eisenbacteria bacterium]
MIPLKIHLLGTPLIRRGDRLIPIRRRKALALLAYLAVTGRSHSREALSTLLWPEADPARSHANLRNLLWILKQEVAPIELSAEYDTVELAREGVWTDVIEFRERSRAGRGTDGRGFDIPPRDADLLAGAASLYRDHFMAGFGLKDSYSFDEWQLHEKETARAEFASVLDRLVRYHRTRHEFDKAILYGRRWLSLDPFHEPAQREMMDLYTEAGQRTSAIELYDQSARLLEKELGLTPAEETTELRNRILSAGLARIARAPEVERSRHNLPARETRFIGREEEMGEIRRLLGDPDWRLLTLVGPGGSGKTRLAIQAAEEQLGAYPDGIFFVPLASVVSPKNLIPTIVETLRVPLPRGKGEKGAAGRRAGVSERRLLADYLREKRMLLVLDNMEHLLGALDDVREILEEAPDVQVIATSRERLRMGGEYVLELDGLPYPEEGADREEYDSSPAVRLFLNAAKRADVSFTPEEDNRDAIGRICRRLRGGPLGIELAAAWTKMFRCDEIDAEIEKSLDFLTSRQRNIPERHRSIRAVFDHSWKMLSEKERTCFRRLASFRGGFTREAARETAGCPIGVLEILGDKSLLHADPSGRYEIHEVLRQFAEEKLRENQEEHDEVVGKLVDYYLKKMARLEKAIEGGGQKEALMEIAREIENIRTAWIRASEMGRIESMRGAFFTLFLYFDIRSRFPEGADFFDEAIRLLEKRDEEDAGLLLGALYTGRAWFVRYERVGLCEELIRRGLKTLEPLGPTPEYAFALVVSAILFMDYAEKEKVRLEEALAIFEREGNRFWEAMTLEVISSILTHTDHDEALRCGQKCLRLRHQMGDRWGIALSHVLLGRIAEQQDLPRVAKKRYWESVRIRREMGEDLDGCVNILERIGTLARRTGNFDETFRLFEECIRLSREMGHDWRVAFSQTRLGMIAYDMGRWDRAREELESAVDFAQSLGDLSWVNLLYAVLADNAFASGDLQEARFLLGQIVDRGEELRSNERNPPLDIGSVRGYRSAWLDLAAGRIAAEDGDWGGALRRYRAALRPALEDMDEPTVLETLGEIARVRFGAGDPDRAARLLGFLLERETLTPNARERAEKLRGEMVRALKSPRLREGMAPGSADEYPETARRELEEGAD